MQEMGDRSGSYLRNVRVAALWGVVFGCVGAISTPIRHSWADIAVFFAVTLALWVAVWPVVLWRREKRRTDDAREPRE